MMGVPDPGGTSDGTAGAGTADDPDKLDLSSIARPGLVVPAADPVLAAVGGSGGGVAAAGDDSTASLDDIVYTHPSRGVRDSAEAPQPWQASAIFPNQGLGLGMGLGMDASLGTDGQFMLPPGRTLAHNAAALTVEETNDWVNDARTMLPVTHARSAVGRSSIAAAAVPDAAGSANTQLHDAPRQQPSGLGPMGGGGDGDDTDGAHMSGSMAEHVALGGLLGDDEDEAGVRGRLGGVSSRDLPAPAGQVSSTAMAAAATAAVKASGLQGEEQRAAQGQGDAAGRGWELFPSMHGGRGGAGGGGGGGADGRGLWPDGSAGGSAGQPGGSLGLGIGAGSRASMGVGGGAVGVTHAREGLPGSNLSLLDELYNVALASSGDGGGKPALRGHAAGAPAGATLGSTGSGAHRWAWSVQNPEVASSNGHGASHVTDANDARLPASLLLGLGLGGAGGRAEYAGAQQGQQSFGRLLERADSSVSRSAAPMQAASAAPPLFQDPAILDAGTAIKRLSSGFGAQGPASSAAGGYGSEWLWDQPAPSAASGAAQATKGMVPFQPPPPPLSLTRSVLGALGGGGAVPQPGGSAFDTTAAAAASAAAGRGLVEHQGNSAPQGASAGPGQRTAAGATADGQSAVTVQAIASAAARVWDDSSPQSTVRRIAASLLAVAGPGGGGGGPGAHRMVLESLLMAVRRQDPVACNKAGGRKRGDAGLVASKACFAMRPCRVEVADCVVLQVRGNKSTS